MPIVSSNQKPKGLPFLQSSLDLNDSHRCHILCLNLEFRQKSTHLQLWVDFIVDVCLRQAMMKLDHNLLRGHSTKRAAGKSRNVAACLDHMGVFKSCNLPAPLCLTSLLVFFSSVLVFKCLNVLNNKKKHKNVKDVAVGR